MMGLDGKQVVVTRAKSQAEEMGELITSRGGIPYFFPVIEPQLTKELRWVDQAIRHLDQYDWIIFTSVNAVLFFIQRMQHVFATDRELVNQSQTAQRPNDLGDTAAQEPIEAGIALLNRKEIAAIGPKTAKALYEYGVNVTATPNTYQQEALIEACKDRLHKGMKVLYPRAQMARRHLREQLQTLGICVDEVELYETIPVEAGKEELLHRMKANTIDIITFTSSSTVENFVRLFEETSWRDYLDSIVIACIGPITAQTARDLGLRVDVEAKKYTAESLLAEIDCFFNC